MTFNTQPQSSRRLKLVTLTLNDPMVSTVQVPSQPILIIMKDSKSDEEDEVVVTSFYDLMTRNMYIKFCVL